MVAVELAGIDVAGLRTNLAPYRVGRHDPTTQLAPDHFWRATLTPDGPGTLHLSWGCGTLTAQAWGPGAKWLERRAPLLAGRLDRPAELGDGHPVVARAARNHPGLRIGASGTLYHDLLPVIIGQRITGGEAIRQWQRLVRRLGRPAPGPDRGLLLPPDPARLAATPAWWFHPLGIEARRAEALRTVARHAARIGCWHELPAHECARRLALLRGIGQWTIGSVLGMSLGDPDAVAVGDYHLKNVVSYALAGEPRGTDERMLELLEPFAGQRGRVVRLLLLDGHRAPAFGPRQRVLAMSRW